MYIRNCTSKFYHSEHLLKREHISLRNTKLNLCRSVESPDKPGQAVRNKFTGVKTDNHKIPSIYPLFQQ